MRRCGRERARRRTDQCEMPVGLPRLFIFFAFSALFFCFFLVLLYLYADLSRAFDHILIVTHNHGGNEHQRGY
jgi:hypothetical protein